MQKRFEFTANVEVLLMNGETIKRSLSDHVLSTSRDAAALDVRGVILDIIADWDCNDIDAPVDEILDISNIRFRTR
jgi:hypothetical protein